MLLYNEKKGVIFMKNNLYGKSIILFLIITLLITFSFTTGFTAQSNNAGEDEGIVVLDDGEEEEESTKWVCTCGYVYDPEVEGFDFENLPDDWVCPDCGASKGEFFEFTEEEEEEEVLKWTCPCGYVYDPEETGISFEDLPDDWVCPECGMPKGSFEADITLDEEDSKLSKFQHVLAMRMKHIEVLLRVQEAKEDDQHSKEAIGNAIVQSSKSIFKMQEFIAAYVDSLGESTEETADGGSDTGTEDENEEDGDSDDDGKQDKAEKSNKGKDNKPEKDKKSNKGKAKGKNK
jgi:rubredoxin